MHRYAVSVSRTLAAALAGALVMAGCAPKRPVLYPNATVQRSGPVAAQQAIETCVAMSEAAGVSPNRAANVAGSAAKTAAIASAAGAAAGAVRGHAGRGAAMGAAGGGAGGFMRGLFRARDPSPMQRRFVEICLREHGYRSIGWK